MKLRIPSYLFTLFLVLGVLATRVSAQSVTFDQVLGGTGGKIEHVELSNGGANISIPLVNVKGRGMNFTFRLNYSSKNLQAIPLIDGSVHWQIRFPWRFSTPTSFKNPGGSWSPVTTCKVNGVTYTIGVTSNLIFSLPDGSQELTPNLIWDSLAGFCNPPLTAAGYPIAYSSDLTAFAANGYIGGKVLLPDGSTPAEDSNGNYITEQNPSAQTTNYIDSTGRPILSTSNVAYSYGPPSATVYYPNILTLIDGRQIKLIWGNIQITTSFGNPASAQNLNQYSVPVLQEIDLPNNTAWKFQYGSDPNCPQIGNYGQLAKVIFPQGGYVRYCYAVQPNFVAEWGMEDGLVVSNRYESPDGVTENGTSYSYGLTYNSTNKLVTQRSITLTKPTLDTEIHTYKDFNALANNQMIGQEFYESDVDYRKGATTSIRMIHKDWACDSVPKTVVSRGTSLGVLFNLGNCRVSAATTTVSDTPSPLTSQVQYQYDASLSGTAPAQAYQVLVFQSFTTSFGNVTKTLEYDWGTNGAPGPLLRETGVTYLTNNAANGSVNYLDPSINIVRKPVQTVVKDGAGNILGQAQYEYDGSTLATTSGAPQHDYSNFPASYRVRGNLTKESRWLNTTGTWLATVNTYNDLGNRPTTTDPGGHTTSFDYTDNFTDGVNRNTQAYQTTVAFPQTGSVQHIEHKSYFYNTGLTASFKDQNAQTTNYAYETLNRPSSISYIDGGKTSYSYNDVPPVSVTTTTAIDSTNNLVNASVHDGLDRVKQTQLNSDPEGVTYTDITYDALGRKSTASNPYRSTSDATYGITTTQYDALDRVVLLIPPDGTTSSNMVTTSYCANAALTTDQAGKWRRTITDGLGRAVEVDEPNGPTAAVTACPQTGDPVMVTRYSYDALDNLICVEQHGSATGTGCSSPPSGDSTSPWRVRRYTYNSLSQLTQMTNPETGANKYTYDSDGNILTKVDGRNVTVTHTYDPLHRITSDTYSNGDPAVSYSYDESSCLGQASCFNINHRTSMTDAAGSEAWSFDSRGRPITQSRTTSGITKTTILKYNLTGATTSLTYPSGRIINFAYSKASRPTSATDQSTGTLYVSGASYAPQGSPSLLTFQYTNHCSGAGCISADIYSRAAYNSRLQPTQLVGCAFYSTGGLAPTRGSASVPSGVSCNNDIPFLNLSYAFLDSNGHNNGDIQQIANNLNSDRTESFTYDELNRLKTATTQATIGTSCWGQQFSYDAWSNLTSIIPTKCAAPQFSPAYNLKNQIRLVGAISFGYDAAGNITQDGTSNNYAWNAEELLGSAAGVTYKYDGDGRRVQKSSGTIYWYGPANEVLNESDASGNIIADYIFFGGRRVARRDSSGAIFTYFSDHLGTSRILIQGVGAGPCYDSDFYPFGGEINYVNSCPQNYKFTGRERDTETQLDYFGARYYSSSYGRFLSPDLVQLKADRLVNPQRINLYAYALNNPLSFIDPDGNNAWDVFKTGVIGVAVGINNTVNHAYYAIVATAKDPFAPVDAAISFADRGLKAYETPEARRALVAQFKALSAEDKVAVVTEALIIGGLAGSANANTKPGMTPPAQNALAEAVLARDAAAAESGNVGGVTAAYSKSGAVGPTVGTSGGLARLGGLNPKMAQLAGKVGGVGAENPGAAAPVGCCAEFDAINQLLNLGADLDDIGLTDVIRPRTGEVIPPCPNCEAMFEDVLLPPPPPQEH